MVNLIRLHNLTTFLFFVNLLWVNKSIPSTPSNLIYIGPKGGSCANPDKYVAALYDNQIITNIRVYVAWAGAAQFNKGFQATQSHETTGELIIGELKGSISLNQHDIPFSSNNQLTSLEVHQGIVNDQTKWSVKSGPSISCGNISCSSGCNFDTLTMTENSKLVGIDVWVGCSQMVKQSLIARCNENQSAILDACIKCANNCLTCIGPNENQCSSCAIGFLFFQEKFCVSECPNHTFNKTPICTDCDSNCENCSILSTNCTSCYEAFGLFNQSCVSQCPKGFYKNISSQVCKECNSNCAECSFLTTNCTKCYSEYGLQNNSCQKPCPDGLFLDFDNCTQCNSTCRTCTAFNICSSCNSPNALHNSLCLLECPVGMYKNSESENSICLQCNLTKCKECSIESDNCIECNINQTLINNSCYFDCPQGQFKGNDSKCAQCDQFVCKACLNSKENCTACYEELKLLSEKCIRKCPDGFQEKVDKFQNICEKCNSSCQTCNISFSNCTSCIFPYGLLNGNCQSMCPEGSYLNVQNLCSSCDNDCLACNFTRSNCTKCKQEEGLLNFTCYSECPSGYFFEKGICEKCINNCKTCKETSSNCTTCFENQTWVKWKCLEHFQCEKHCFEQNQDQQNCTLMNDCSEILLSISKTISPIEFEIEIENKTYNQISSQMQKDNFSVWIEGKWKDLINLGQTNKEIYNQEIVLSDSSNILKLQINGIIQGVEKLHINLNFTDSIAIENSTIFIINNNFTFDLQKYIPTSIKMDEEKSIIAETKASIIISTVTSSVNCAMMIGFPISFNILAVNFIFGLTRFIKLYFPANFLILVKESGKNSIAKQLIIPNEQFICSLSESFKNSAQFMNNQSILAWNNTTIFWIQVLICLFAALIFWLLMQKRDNSLIQLQFEKENEDVPVAAKLFNQAIKVFNGLVISFHPQIIMACLVNLFNPCFANGLGILNFILSLLFIQIIIRTFQMAIIISDYFKKERESLIYSRIHLSFLKYLFIAPTGESFGAWKNCQSIFYESQDMNCFFGKQNVLWSLLRFLILEICINFAQEYPWIPIIFLQLSSIFIMISIYQGMNGFINKFQDAITEVLMILLGALLLILQIWDKMEQIDESARLTLGNALLWLNLIFTIFPGIILLFFIGDQLIQIVLRRQSKNNQIFASKQTNRKEKSNSKKRKKEMKDLSKNISKNKKN